MNTPSSFQIITGIHSILMRLYPPGFRTIFENEMQAVFSKTLRDASEDGTFSIGVVILRELRDLPIAAVNERLLERQSGGTQSNKSTAQPAEPLTQMEILLALAVFLVPAGFILYNSAPSPLVNKFVPPILVAFLLAGSLVGMIKRFPRWSLPYFGLVLSAIVFLFLFQGEAQRMSALLSSRFSFHLNDELSRLLLVIFWDGMVWLSLLALVTFSVLLLSRVPKFVPLVQLMLDDWTRLSYLLYGSSMLALVLTFDAYNYDADIALVALLCLAAGAWVYLRSNRPKRRFMALLAGLTLAMLVAFTGKWMGGSQLDWTGWLRLSTPGYGRWLDPGQGLVGWAWMVIVITLPGLLRLLPRTRSSRLVE
ncbi:MAG: hypothetical protein MUO67_01540 [Anaerolineales bacterium]|jgi:hypothetical protein|nr:hypothetical protein [Anaerolineales bacterium]